MGYQFLAYSRTHPYTFNSTIHFELYSKLTARILGEDRELGV